MCNGHGPSRREYQVLCITVHSLSEIALTFPKLSTCINRGKVDDSITAQYGNTGNIRCSAVIGTSYTKSDHNNVIVGWLKSYAKYNGAGGSAANHLGQDNVDENEDVDWDNMS